MSATIMGALSKTFKKDGRVDILIYLVDNFKASLAKQLQLLKKLRV